MVGRRKLEERVGRRRSRKANRVLTNTLTAILKRIIVKTSTDVGSLGTETGHIRSDGNNIGKTTKLIY
jgi:hypothetical protein